MDIINQQLIGRQSILRSDIEHMVSKSNYEGLSPVIAGRSLIDLHLLRKLVFNIPLKRFNHVEEIYYYLDYHGYSKTARKVFIAFNVSQPNPLEYQIYNCIANNDVESLKRITTFYNKVDYDLLNHLDDAIRNHNYNYNIGEVLDILFREKTVIVDNNYEFDLWIELFKNPKIYLLSEDRIKPLNELYSTTEIEEIAELVGEHPYLVKYIDTKLIAPICKLLADKDNVIQFITELNDRGLYRYLPDNVSEILEYNIEIDEFGNTSVRTIDDVEHLFRVYPDIDIILLNEILRNMIRNNVPVDVVETFMDKIEYNELDIGSFEILDSSFPKIYKYVHLDIVAKSDEVNISKIVDIDNINSITSNDLVKGLRALYRLGIVPSTPTKLYEDINRNIKRISEVGTINELDTMANLAPYFDNLLVAGIVVGKWLEMLGYKE